MLDSNGNIVTTEERPEVVPPSPPTLAPPSTLDPPPAPLDEQRIAWARWELLLYFIIIALALGLRLWDLGAKALHHDESLHAVYSWYLYVGRGYTHDPMMHGPFQFFGTAAMYWVFGDSDTTARLLAAIFGTILVALPMMLRRYIGRSGALVTSVMLTISPSMLYFSRFARDEIYMSVWTLSLIALMWAYLTTRKVRYLILASAVLAFAFATKENTYMLVIVLGSYLFIAAATDVIPWLIWRKKLREFSPEGNLLVLLATLVLPLGAAGIAIFQGPLGLTLANPDWTKGPIGMPIGSGLYVAFITAVVLFVAAVVVGLLWRPKLWLVCFGVFATIWLLLHSSFFTNFPGGFLSGLWQSLGYWLAQQGVARGGQPWYYYFVIGFNYEYLPLIVGTVALVYYSFKGDRFSRFLAYWAVLNTLLYVYASEKMPWLLIEVTLPFIILSGKLLGGFLERRPWERLVVVEEAGAAAVSWFRRVQWPSLAFAVMLVLLLAVAGRWMMVGLVKDSGMGLWLSILLAFLVLALLASCVYLLRQVSKGQRAASLGLAAAVAMLAFTVPSSFRVSYTNADVPVETLVYTQTSPDVPQIMADIERFGQETGKGKDLKIIVDSTDAFSWPWAWYLRDYKYTSYPCLSNDSGCRNLDYMPDADVVLLAERSQSPAEPYLYEFGDPVLYVHRWWFPESYRGLNIKSVWSGIRKRESWCRITQYFVYRDFGLPIGSVKAYANFSKDFTPTSLKEPLVNNGPDC